MMATPVIYFVVAAACLLQAECKKPQCTTLSKGDISGRPVPLEETYLAPPSPYWDVPIQNVCNNPGVEVTVCDPDGPPAPTVKIQNNFLVKVQRNSMPKITLPATVKTTVFCYDPWINEVKPIVPIPKQTVVNLAPF